MNVALLAVKLMTYNVNFGEGGRTATMDAIAAGDADVVLLQEITTSWERQLRERFAKTYPHMTFHVHARAAGGLAVLSKAKIASTSIFAPPADGWFPAQRVTIDSAIGPLEILHVHLRPALMHGSWVKGYLETPPIRVKEIETYWQKSKIAPTIVAGDYNELPDLGVLRFLAGKGLARVDTGTSPTTWSFDGLYDGVPLKFAMNIDHVAIAPSFVVQGATVLAQGKSDHRPVVVTLSAKP